MILRLTWWKMRNRFHCPGGLSCQLQFPSAHGCVDARSVLGWGTLASDYGVAVQPSCRIYSVWPITPVSPFSPAKLFSPLLPLIPSKPEMQGHPLNLIMDLYCRSKEATLLEKSVTKTAKIHSWGLLLIFRIIENYFDRVSIPSPECPSTPGCSGSPVGHVL